MSARIIGRELGQEISAAEIELVFGGGNGQPGPGQGVGKIPTMTIIGHRDGSPTTYDNEQDPSV